MTHYIMWHKIRRFHLKIKEIKNMSVKFKPLGDRVLIEAAPSEENGKWNLHSSYNKEKPLKGTVIAVGKGKKEEPMTVKNGDTVLYGQYSGTEQSMAMIT